MGDEAGEMGDDLGAVPLGTGRLAHAVTGGRDYVCAILQDGDLKVGFTPKTKAAGGGGD